MKKPQPKPTPKKRSDPVEIRYFAKKAHENAKEKGFWEGDERNFLEALMLIVSEAGECCEAFRKDKQDKIGEELADIMIRVADLSEGLGIDIQDEITKKMEFNRTRPYKHNRKC